MTWTFYVVSVLMWWSFLSLSLFFSKKHKQEIRFLNVMPFEWSWIGFLCTKGFCLSVPAGVTKFLRNSEEKGNERDLFPCDVRALTHRLFFYLSLYCLDGKNGNDVNKSGGVRTTNPIKNTEKRGRKRVSKKACFSYYVVWGSRKADV
jgi:hypothetical protein